MKLIELFRSLPADAILVTIGEMFPDTESFQDIFSDALALILTLTPVETKKKIRYKVLVDDESDIEYFGAEDSNFATSWESCLGKEVEKDAVVELSDVEIAANSLVNMCFLARCPRQFLPRKNALLEAVK